MLSARLSNMHIPWRLPVKCSCDRCKECIRLEANISSSMLSRHFPDPQPSSTEYYAPEPTNTGAKPQGPSHVQYTFPRFIAKLRRALGTRSKQHRIQPKRVQPFKLPEVIGISKI
eukprot:296041-Pelagomonas_calceolata.AAC.3